MRHSRSFILAASLLMASCLAQAQDRSSGNCEELPTGSEQKRCVELQFRATADELKQVYGQALERALKADTQRTPSGDQRSSKAAIIESQQAWEAYRDAECRGVVGRGHGSGTVVWVLGCLAEKNRGRTRELKVPYDQR
jgi:uncharacterized protein YecT (DUF1311 family)